ncbi:hypothetical protein HPB52_008694 [Rhipicephalus sanguineus]|uniref:Uncharacterized protein n=1 Tax=Rhipicephalus sanguineus TaxID=34632 RepID=A0A9D4SU79_RHISA|nr:hypothetical protein HPB52_008694 [Rhipicephalus sanguineus]
MKYFVYVKYLTDNVKKVTTSDHVQNLKPRDVNDFAPGDTYSVYWDGDDSTKGGYYDADLLHMTGLAKCEKIKGGGKEGCHCRPGAVPQLPAPGGGGAKAPGRQ